MIPSLAAVASAVLVIVLSRRHGWGWTAPMNLYVMVWAAGVLIYSVRLFPFYDIAPTTWLLIALAGAAFVVGVFYGGRQRVHTPDPPRRDTTAPDDRLDVPSWLLRLFLVIGLAGFALFLSQVQRLYGLATFFQLPLLIHNAISNRYVSSSYLFPYYFGVAGTILFGYRLIVLRWKPGAADVLLLGCFALAMALSTERNHFLWCLASWMFCYFLPPAGDRSLRRIVAGGLVAALIGIGFYLGVGQWLNKSPENISETLRLIVEREKRLGHLRPPDDRLNLLLRGGRLHRFSVLYVALGEPLPSLDQAMKSSERTYGALTFRPIARALVRAGLVTDVVRGSTYEEVPTPYPSNAYTYLFEPYRDFGWPGAIVLPALLGVLLGYAYRSAAIRGGGAWALFLTQMQGMVLWAAFQNRFVLTVSWYLCTLLLVGCLAGPFQARFRRALAALPAGTRAALWALVAVGAAASIVVTVLARKTEPPRPLDVILVTVDTLRVDHVGAYGATAGSTPAIDRLAAGGVVFARAVAPASVTGPSLSTLLTSHYPHETQITDNGLPLPPGVLTLPELLRGAGYWTCAVLSNPVLRPPGDFPQGFDVYDTDLPQTELGRPAFKERRADATTDRALQVLKERDPNKRLFLWVHYIDPHGPYAPPEARPETPPADERQLPVNPTNTGRGGIPKYQYIWNERSASLYRARYRQEIAFLDSHLARLFEALDQPSIREHALVIFTADHGESLGEHDYYFAHGEYLYPELIDVPLIVRGPGLGTGRRRDLVGLVDILPSIAAYLHVPLRDPVRGAAIFERPAPATRTLLAATYPGSSLTERFTAIRPDEQIIYSAPASVELLRDGKPAKIDVRSASFTSFERELKRLIAENQLTGFAIPERPALSNEAAERLRALGYVR